MAIAPSGVVLASAGFIGETNYGSFRRAALQLGDDAHASLQLSGDTYDVQFPTREIAERFQSELRVQADHAAAIDASPGSLASPGSIRLEAEERLLHRCKYIGGAYLQLRPEVLIDLAFREDRLEIYDHPSTAGSPPRETIPFSKSFKLELTGPGKVTKGGGFFGGGFGLIGAAEGMAIAGLLNAMTKKTTILTLIGIADAKCEGFFVNSTVTPDNLRRALSPVFVRLRRYEAIDEKAPPPSDDDLSSRLERLAKLHSAGALTDSEFAEAKAVLLRG